MVNMSLLANWRWRLLEGENSLWKDLLRDKYGNGVDNIIVDVGDLLPRHSSS